jgi:thiamine biosynthesis lipoprotein
MNTDVLCEVIFPPSLATFAETSLDNAFTMFREFETRFSRFRRDNELWTFNHSTESVLSPELFDILERILSFHRLTEGIFDPSILPALEETGYTSTPYQNHTRRTSSLSTLVLDRTTLTARKPLDLILDLGGIGKGYIVDQVAASLHAHFEHVLVDAGGDIRVYGENAIEHYPYFAIEVEHPLPDHPSPLLMLRDMAVATSGRNRRHWVKDGVPRHHLIDPATDTSANSDLVTVTVIAPTTTEADVWAKTLYIAGLEHGQALALTHALPAIFMASDDTIVINSLAQPYVWKP